MIKLLASSLIVDHALAYARSHKLAPLTVAVLDARGCTIMLKAEDGSMRIRLEPLPEMPDYLKQVVEEMK